jgi:hypothetical protein
MESQNWTKIFTTTEAYQADIAKDVLAMEGIESVIMDKRDSAYGSFGELSLFVANQFAEQATAILNRKAEEE